MRQKAMTESREKLRPMAARAVQDWGVLLAKELGADESWRLLLTAAIVVAEAIYEPRDISSMLRELADGIDGGGLKPSNTNLN